MWQYDELLIFIYVKETVEGRPRMGIYTLQIGSFPAILQQKNMARLTPAMFCSLRKPQLFRNTLLNWSL